MDKKTILSVMKTKMGKISMAFVILGILSLLACFMNVENVGSGILGAVVFGALGVLFFFKGKKLLSSPVELSSNKNESIFSKNQTYINKSKKVKFTPTKKVKKYFHIDL